MYTNLLDTDFQYLNPTDRTIYYGYVKQDGLYITEDLLITDKYILEYSDFYKNSEGWYKVRTSFDLREVIHHLWKIYSSHGSKNFINIRMNLEDTYIIEQDTITKMFAEEFIK